MPTPAPHKQPHQTQWEKVKLGDIGEVITGKTPSTDKLEYWDSKDYMFITPPDLKRGTTIYQASRYISAKGLQSIKTNSISGFSILVGCIGSDLGNIACVDSTCATNQQINALTNIKPQCNTHYVYHYLTLLKKYFRQIAAITTAPIVSKSMFENIKIPLPPLPTQENIAQILSTLDKKIELNTRINTELESMAKLLYTRYFVEYNFPDSSGKPYKTSGGAMVYNPTLKREIPQDWEVIKLANRFNFERGEEFGTASYKESKVNKHHIKFYRVGDMIDDSKCVYVDSSKENAPLISENDLLVSFDGSVGRVAYGLNGTYSSGIRKITDKHGEICQSGLYFIFTDSHIQHTINQHATGTNIKHAGSAIENLYMPYSKEVFSDFQNKINSMFALIRHTKAQSQRLAEWRDYLLPLLMGDQVEVV